MSENAKENKESERGDGDVEVLGKYIHEHRTEKSAPTVKVQVERGQRGGYGWTISLEGETWETLKQALKIIDADLREMYSVGSEVEK